MMMKSLTLEDSLKFNKVQLSQNNYPKYYDGFKQFKDILNQAIDFNNKKKKELASYNRK